jgi:hypothetical protein
LCPRRFRPIAPGEQLDGKQLTARQLEGGLLGLIDYALNLGGNGSRRRLQVLCLGREVDLVEPREREQQRREEEREEKQAQAQAEAQEQAQAQAQAAQVQQRGQAIQALLARISQVVPKQL